MTWQVKYAVLVNRIFLSF